MDPKSLRRWRSLLTTRRAELVAAGSAKIEPNRRDATTSGVADEDEQALSEMLQTLASTRNRESAQLLAAMDRALRKIELEPDDFGACEDCEEDIPARRLEVMPWAAFCTGCQAKQDPQRNVARKKITDYR